MVHGWPPSSCASERVISLWGTLCHRVESGVSRFIPSVRSNVGSELGLGIRWATEPVLAAPRGEVPDNVYNKKVIPRWERRFGGQRVRKEN